MTLDRDRPLLGAGSTAPDELRDDVAIDLPAPRDVYRWAIQRGWSTEAAGNWAAYCAGLPLVGEDDAPVGPWRIREVEHLEFLRALVGAGQLVGDTA